jgi:uncharacterized membrane protein
MGGAHAHAHGAHDAAAVPTGPLPRLLLLGGLALAGLATVVGLVVLWPSAERPTVPYAAEGVSFPEATVVEVGEPCPVIVADPALPREDRVTFPEGCDELVVELESGQQTTVRMPPGVATSGLRPGDTVELSRIPGQGPAPATYSWFTIERSTPLVAMALVFVVVVGVVARLRGLLALAGLGFAGAVVWFFMLPALLDGGSGLGIALAGSSLIMFVVLYLAHGLSIRTSTALAGTLVGTLVIALVGELAVRAARLGGVSGEGTEMLFTYAPDLDFGGLLTCAVIVAGLGVLNDVTITQSSSVWEIRAAGPTLSRRAVFLSGMRIGRDHIASTIYTIVFAYAGTALGVLLLVSLYDRGLAALLSDESVSEEIVRTLAAGIGLVLAVPVTTGIAALTVAGPTAPDGTSAAPS